MILKRSTQYLKIIMEKDFNDGRKNGKLPATSKLIYNPSSAAPGFR